jgi:hypothetical protein
MKKQVSQIMFVAAIAVCALTVKAADGSDQSEFPTITAQPTDQGTWVGTSATFAVQATNGDISYKWRRNGKPIDGQTNSVLELDNVGVTDVGQYSCDVAKDGGDAVPTRSASLSVMAASDLPGGGPITVFGAPVVSNGGITNTCPGPYAGYVNFTKTVAQGWGWVPSTNTTIHTATDWNRSDTKVLYGGKYSDTGCAQTSVTVPDPTPSPKYRFTIYFPNNVPTNAYPITLDGFDP